MKRKRREQKKQPAFMYVFPRDEDQMIIGAFAAGGISALACHPAWKTRDVLEAEARANLKKFAEQKKQPLTNDFAAMCSIAVAYYISGFETAFRRYETDPAQLEENKALLAEQGPERMHAEHVYLIAGNLADNLAGIKADQKQFFPDI